MQHYVTTSGLTLFGPNKRLVLLTAGTLSGIYCI